MPERTKIGEAQVNLSALLIDRRTLESLGVISQNPRTFDLTLEVRLQNPITREVSVGSDEILLVLDVYETVIDNA